MKAQLIAALQDIASYVLPTYTINEQQYVPLEFADELRTMAKETLKTWVEALVCPKCAETNRPGLSHIEYDPHLRAANCAVCGAAWCVKPATN